VESTTVRRAFRFRLEPTATQAQMFAQFAGARRWVWNWALAEMQRHYKETGQTLPASVLSARLTALKDEPETAWLKEMDSQALQQALADLRQAFVNFFQRRARYPRFKSRKRDRARFRLPQRVKVVAHRVVVPKIGAVRLRLSQPVVGTTKSATFKQDACGRWHVTLVAEHEVPAPALPRPTQSAR
jgi:putative transposase